MPLTSNNKYKNRISENLCSGNFWQSGNVRNVLRMHCFEADKISVWACLLEGTAKTTSKLKKKTFKTVYGGPREQSNSDSFDEKYLL